MSETVVRKRRAQLSQGPTPQDEAREAKHVQEELRRRFYEREREREKPRRR